MFSKIINNNWIKIILFFLLSLLLISSIYGIWFGITWSICLDNDFRKQMSFPTCAGLYSIVFSLSTVVFILLVIIFSRFIWLLSKWLYKKVLLVGQIINDLKFEKNEDMV